MSLRFIDGFSHYASGDLFTKWTAQYNTGGGGSEILTSGGRFGSGRLHQWLHGTGEYIGTYKIFDSQSTWIIGMAFNLNVLPGNSNVAMFGWYDTANGWQDYVTLDSQGILRVTRNGTVLAAAVTPNVILVNQWYFFEWKLSINSSTGISEVRINGDVWVTYTGNTEAYGSGTANRLSVGMGVNGQGTGQWEDMYVCDLYICDGNGSANKDYLGDTRVMTLLPSGVGTTTQMTVTGATSNWQAVDNATPDGDTSYVASATVGNEDTYAMNDLSSTSFTVKAVQTVVDVRKDDAGPRTIAPVIRSGGADYAGTNVTLGSGYQFTTQVWENDPATGSAWTPSGVNSAEAGVKVTS